MDKELIEKIAKLIGNEISIFNRKKTAESIHKLYLDAGYVQQWMKCTNPACCGGQVASYDGFYPCPICHGTGKVQLYARLAEDQTEPSIYHFDKQVYTSTSINNIQAQASHNMFNFMTTPKDNTVWAKIIKEER